MVWLPMFLKNFDDMFSNFNIIRNHHRQVSGRVYGQTDVWTSYDSMAYSIHGMHSNTR